MKTFAPICLCCTYEAPKPLPGEPHHYVDHWKEPGGRVTWKLPRIWHVDFHGPGHQTASRRDFFSRHVKDSKASNPVEDLLGYRDAEEFENLRSSLMTTPPRSYERNGQAQLRGITWRRNQRRPKTIISMRISSFFFSKQEENNDIG